MFQWLPVGLELSIVVHLTEGPNKMFQKQNIYVTDRWLNYPDYSNE